MHQASRRCAVELVETSSVVGHGAFRWLWSLQRAQHLDTFEIVGRLQQVSTGSVPARRRPGPAG
jgi:hypothetical protein